MNKFTRIFLLLIPCLILFYSLWFWHYFNIPKNKIQGNWVWTDTSIFEFQKINFRFTADSFYVMQRFMDPKKPNQFMPCSQMNHQIYAKGHYILSLDTLRFKGDFTDSNFSRDTLRLCRDTGFKGYSNFTLSGDSLYLKAGPTQSMVCLIRRK